jgi:hypothetical protein
MARVIYQNATHHLSRDAKKVRAIPPAYILANESKVRLVHQGRCLQCMIGTLAAEIGTS